MIQSYKKSFQLADNYDCIIIGSGIGGLTTAAILAKEGQKVLVLERHYTPGGFTHIFKRKDFEWDVGIHYIGEVGRERSILRQVFDYVSDGNLHWADIGEVYDKIVIGDEAFDFVKGVQNFKEKMISYFPDEEEAIEEYIKLVFAAVKTSLNFFIDKTIPQFASTFGGSFLRNPFYKYSDKTTYEVLSGLTKNEKLIKVLSGQYGDYGLPPKQSSFFMHATVVKHYFAGGYFPIGGSSQIVDTMDPIIEKAGGTILISAAVEEIIIEKGKATGVKMSDGKEIFATNVVSSAGIFNTYNSLLPSEAQSKVNIEKALTKIKPSVSHGCLYIGLEGSPEELNLPKTNYWIYPAEGDHDECVDRFVEDFNSEFPVVYISFPSAKDPDWSNRYPGKSTIDIITLLPYDKFAKWKDTRWMKRGEEYDKLKADITERLLKVLYKHIPQVEGKVVHTELSTPLTTEHFVNYKSGEIYGIDHTPQRFRQRSLKPRTPIKNLYLTGQDIVTCGIGAALFSGVLTSSAMTGKNILNKILKRKK